MTLLEIGSRLPRPRRTYFGRRGPWGAHFARSGNNNKTTKGTAGDLTRRWAHGPANFYQAGLSDTPRVPQPKRGTQGRLPYERLKKKNNNKNSPGQRPIGVLDLVYSPRSFWNVPRPRKVSAPGPSAAKVGAKRLRSPPVNLRQGHGDLVFAMDPVDTFTIIPKNARI